MRGRSVKGGTGHVHQGTAVTHACTNHNSDTTCTLDHLDCAFMRSHHHYSAPHVTSVFIVIHFPLDDGNAALYTKPLHQPTSTRRARWSSRATDANAAGVRQCSEAAARPGGRTDMVAARTGGVMRHGNASACDIAHATIPPSLAIASHGPNAPQRTHASHPADMAARVIRGREGRRDGWRDVTTTWSSMRGDGRSSVRPGGRRRPGHRARGVHIRGWAAAAAGAAPTMTEPGTTNEKTFGSAVDEAPTTLCPPVARRSNGSGKPIIRIGEATNPGPVHGGWRRADDVMYRDPDATGFWQVRAPGHDNDGNQGDGRHTFRIITANTTAWAPLQKLLLRSDADVILAQEHRLPPWRIAEASDWARRHRWHSIMIPARETEAGGWSGGVAILARPHAALSAPRIGPETVVAARVVAACVQPPGHRPCLVVSAYLHDGVGLSSTNLGVLADIGTCVKMHGENHPFIIGGDFQMQPSELANAGFGDQVGGTLIASGAARGTCRSARHSSELDYFYVGNALALAVKSVDTVEDAGTRPHVPVALTFHPRVTTARALFLRLPQPLPVERVYGPIQKEPDWGEVSDMIRELAAEARLCNLDGDFYDKYRAAYSAWADKAEVEVIAATGHQGQVKLGLRGREPKLVWRSVVPEKVRDPANDEVIQWRIMSGIANDILRITAYKLSSDQVGGASGDAPESAANGDDEVALDDDKHVEGGQLYLRQLDECSYTLDQIANREGIIGGIIINLRSIINEVRANILGAARLATCDGGGAASTAEAQATRGRDELAAAALELRDTITAGMERAAADERAAAYQAWKEWLLRNIDSGARNAHRYLRLPEQWRPTTTLATDGIVTADPLQLLDAYRDKYKKLWQGSDADAADMRNMDKEANTLARAVQPL